MAGSNRRSFLKIYIGEDIWISKENILGTFMREALLKSKDGRAFLGFFEKNFLIHKIEGEVKSYILTMDGDNMILFESNVSTNSIKNKVNDKFKVKGMN